MTAWRVGVFVALCLLCVVSTVAFVAWKVTGAQPHPAQVDPPVAHVGEALQADPLQAVLDRPHLIFVDVTDPVHKRLAVASLHAPDTSRHVTSTSCDRVYFASGHGLCSGSEEHYYGNRGLVDFDAHFQPVHSYSVAEGISSRARVSPDGHYGSVTLFVAGDSYGAPFSTRNHIFDLVTGGDLGSLEQFMVYRGSAEFQSPSFNFWGTTFAADGNRFYATLAEGSVGAPTYLVEGDLPKRQVRVLRPNVECPSLSPDGTKIAFKKRIEAPAAWRIAVLDLATLEETVLNESRTVDDQVEWLDDQHILYGMPRIFNGPGVGSDIWELSTRADDPPRLYLANAVSPAVVR